jgi:hypothetical protein
VEKIESEMVPGDGYMEQGFLKQLICWTKVWIQGILKPWKLGGQDARQFHSTHSSASNVADFPAITTMYSD